MTTNFGKVRITVEFLDRRGVQVHTLELENSQVTHEKGTFWIEDLTQGVDGADYNGQERFEFKGWTGCATFESFQSETEGPGKL